MLPEFHQNLTNSTHPDASWIGTISAGICTHPMCPLLASSGARPSKRPFPKRQFRPLERYGTILRLAEHVTIVRVWSFRPLPSRWKMKSKKRENRTCYSKSPFGHGWSEGERKSLKCVSPYYFASAFQSEVIRRQS